MDMFDVSFTPLKNTTLNMNNEVFSVTGFVVTMKRSPTPFYINVYLPTGLLTIASLIGFIIPVGAEEGRRMGLLVTVFLMLVNISSTERNRGPAVRIFDEIFLKNVTLIVQSDKNDDLHGHMDAPLHSSGLLFYAGVCSGPSSRIQREGGRQMEEQD